MSQFAASSSKAAQSMGELSISSEEAKVYNEQIGNATKNMAALNAVYELQLQDTTTYLKSANKFYDGMNDMLSNLNSSVEQTQKYKEEITILTKNLSALNTVYGNMLSAMSTRVG
jgi:gliding motility-associated protein GldL